MAGKIKADGKRLTNTQNIGDGSVEGTDLKTAPTHPALF
jgi:hypothetical protein